MTWLHGTILVTIVEAQDLPPDRFFRMPGKGRFNATVKPVERFIHKATDVFKKVHRPSAAYVTMDIGPARRLRSGAIREAHPQWNEEFSVLVADEADSLVFAVKDSELIGAAMLGVARVETADLLAEQLLDKWLVLVDANTGEPLERQAMLHVRLQYKSVYADPHYTGEGLAKALKSGVPGVYFPLRHGNRITFYHDAKQYPEINPPIETASGPYQSLGAWDDIYKAISNAEHLIYITGWSVVCNTQLVRRDGVPQSQNGDYLSVGKLLKKKAQEGVRVNLLVWDDRTSLNSKLLKRTGIMATGDEDTREFFRGTQVNCVLAVRSGGGEDSTLQQLKTGGLFTHHGKQISVDAPLGDSGKRHIIGFVGGLDLCDGRYDNGQHSLFKTNATTHSDDLHNAVSKDPVSPAGPREPWHDQHSRLEGPVAADLLTAFVQRWHKHAEDKVDALVPLASIEELNCTHFQGPQHGDSKAFVVDPADPEAFSAQIFRSIDSDSAQGLPESATQVMAAGLTSGKGKIIDTSAHAAYITAIRRAQHHIYIENQYFLGSSQAWEENADMPCHHLIPLEIALKIVAKINAGERFAAYIVVPMYPEGFPDSGAVQEILNMQLKTVRMMYKLIGHALKANSSDLHPRDYLNFYCLGNREVKPPNEPAPVTPPPPNSYLEKMLKARRLMIYVHAKGCIIDDALLLLGSANINQRSMDGSRDTEVVLGTFQPAYLPTKEGTPQGQIYGFRSALWQEHLGLQLPESQQPSSIECVRALNRLAAANWEAFVGEEIVDLPGHLMTYPYKVEADGSVEPLGNIPDTESPIGGTSNYSLPALLTT